MEELQSTEILDREILEDARKKAWRILKSADDAVKAQTAEWEKKTADGLAELKKKYAKRSKMAISEIVSRQPMEKRRIKAQIIDRLLNQAVHTWYAGLDRGYVITLIKNELNVRLAECNDFSAEAGKAFYRELSGAEAEAILRAALPGHKLSFEETPGAEDFPELIIENDTVRISASIKKAVDFFLLEKRAELIQALVGAEASDGENPSIEINAHGGEQW
jgi:hypothetical protein